MKKFFEDAFAIYENNILTVGNCRFKREFDLSAGLLRTLGIYDAAGEKIASETPIDRDFYFHGDICPPDEMHYEVKAVSAVTVDKPFFDSPHLHVIVTLFENNQQMTLRRDMYIYPGLSALAVRTRLVMPILPIALWPYRRGIRDHRQLSARPGLVYEGCTDILAPAPEFVPDSCILYRGRTDFVDDQVTIVPGDGKKELNGNILFIRRPDGKSLFFLQETPTSEERRDVEEYDFRIGSDGAVFSCTWNIAPYELGDEKRELRSGRSVLFFADNGQEELEILHEYQKRRFPAPDVPVTVNPWGGYSGGFYRAISEEFLEREFRSAGECGAEIYQIDDGWQAGGILATLTAHNYRINSQEFWRVRPELWGGSLAPIKAVADECGCGVSMWFAPNFAARYRDWRDMAEILLDFHRRYGVCFFKLDAMYLPCFESEHNLELLMRTVRRRSGGKVSFQIDLTGWGQRQGYFRFQEHGGIFLENRYCMLKSGLGYHPERTWRNVWRLAKYNRLQKFQIEVPATEDINYEFYCDKGETAPDIYPWEYWIAIALFANPLLWMAISKLPSDKRKVLRRYIDWHKSKKEQLKNNRIDRFGNEPDGKSLSGLYTVSGRRLVLALREKECADESVTVPALADGKWQTVLGDGRIENGEVTVNKAAWFAVFEEI